MLNNPGLYLHIHEHSTTHETVDEITSLLSFPSSWASSSLSLKSLPLVKTVVCARVCACMYQEILTTRKARLSPFRSRIIGIKGHSKGSKEDEEVVVANSAIAQPWHMILHCGRRKNISFAIFV